MSKQSIRKTVLEAHDVPEERVALPAAWGGGQVLIRGLTAGELADWAAGFKGRPTKQQSAALIIACVRDPETGEPVFEAADRDLLAGKAALPFGEILGHCNRVCGFDVGPGDDLKADI